MIDSRAFTDRNHIAIAYAFGTTHGVYVRGVGPFSALSDVAAEAVACVEFLESGDVTEGLEASQWDARRAVLNGAKRAGWRR